MGQFKIDLPGNRKGDVRWGRVMRTTSLFRLLPWVKGKVDTRTGYLIKVEPAVERETEYRLFRTNEGSWSQDEDGRVALEGETMLAIKKAIEEQEKTAN